MELITFVAEDLSQSARSHASTKPFRNRILYLSGPFDDKAVDVQLSLTFPTFMC